MSQIKSKERVRDLAEVYTNEREVKAMLDLIPLSKKDDIIRYRYLEPACGNGNFLVEILNRKLERVIEKYSLGTLSNFEFYIARALTTIYGIDICEDNVKESRERLFRQVKSIYDYHKGSFIYSDGFLSLIEYILEKNIIVGDTINTPEDIYLTEFKISGKNFIQSEFRFSDLTQDKPKPLKIIPKTHFLRIGKSFYDERHQGHFSFI